MKRRSIINFSLICLFAVAVLNATAQETIITQQEFLNAQRLAIETPRTLSYRMTSVEKTVDGIETTVSEFAPPDRTHRMTKFVPAGKISSRKIRPYAETIKIGGKVFYRENTAQKWRPSEPVERFVLSVNPNPESRTETTEYKLFPNQTINNEECSLYESVTTVKFASKTEVTSAKYWLNRRNLPIQITFSFNGKETTMNFEYNVALKIEAPPTKDVIPAKKKS